MLLRGPGGTLCWLAPGAVIGRSETAGLRLTDPRVSEMQAYVSLREEGLVLRALKGMLKGRSGRRAEIVLAPGQRIFIARGLALEVLAVHRPISTEPVPHTRPSGQLDPPLLLELRQETVLIHRTGNPTTELTGMSARILCEVARFDAPAPWHWVARELWRGDLDRGLLRQRWDRNNRTLRRKLREVGVREDLIRPDWSGNIELVLGPEDRLIDRS